MSQVKVSLTTCSICNWSSESDSELERVQHLGSRLHRANYLKKFFQDHRAQILSNKMSVEISCIEEKISHHTVQSHCFVGKSTTLTFAIKNKGSDVVFTQYEFLHALPCRSQLYDENSVCDGSRMVLIPENAEEYHVTVTVTPDFVGIYQTPLVFQFSRSEETNPFYIGVIIEVNCSDTIVDLLQKSEQYVAKTKGDVLPAAFTIHRGVKPKSDQKSRTKIRLEKYKINDELRLAIFELQDWFKGALYMEPEERPVKFLGPAVREIYQFLLDRLQPNNYPHYLNLLLNLEEVQMDEDIRKYDMKNAMMYFNSNYPGLLSLRVLGLAEKRPSVLKGDVLYVRIVGEVEDVEYMGNVHAVHETDVLLGFGVELMQKYVKNMKFHVRFTYSKYPSNIMQRALTMIQENHILRWFFPTKEYSARCPPAVNPTGRFIFYNRQIEQNPEQATAIKHIVAGSSLPAPYLLHGPPGTGKTVTVVEAVLQLWKIYKSEPMKAYVLVCTPSNSASDLIAERLLAHIPSHDLFRFYSLSREFSQVPDKIKEKKCFNYIADKTFFVPKKCDLLKYRVVVSTLCNSAKLVSLGIRNEHFTHICIDESGHAVEPEAISPLVGLLKCRTDERVHGEFGGQFVLAGDPMQLGPIIRCRVADEFKLGVSMLERLMSSEIYRKSSQGVGSVAQFDPHLITRLKNNYRSHPAILDLPNNLFYDGELRVCADKLQRESLCHWEGLPNQSFPVLFHGVIGRDMQEKKSPSYFNPQEVSVVLTYVEKLLGARNRGLNIQPKDVGIITPYRQQVYKLNNELSKKNFGKLSVGSVDEFQGQERRVIIISTVRSDPDLMAYDQKYRLGFLKNPKRFNVAITRAKCLLIVIGNPNLLSKDYHWNKFLTYCRQQGSYVGARYETPEDEIDDLLQRFKKLNLLPVEQEPTRESQRAKQEDPEWRNDY